MNVGELIAKLVALPLDAPVVMAQDNEPLGNGYGVAGVELADMSRDGLWSDPAVWHAEVYQHHERHQVVYLTGDQAPAVVVDAEVVEPADQRTTPCPRCGWLLGVGKVTVPGDAVWCSNCRAVVQLPATAPPSQLEYGPGWQALMAAHTGAIEAHDRDTRVLATADAANDELDDDALGHTRVRSAVYGGNPLGVHACVACGNSAPSGPLCGECSAVLEGPGR